MSTRNISVDILSDKYSMIFFYLLKLNLLSYTVII